MLESFETGLYSHPLDKCTQSHNVTKDQQQRRAPNESSMHAQISNKELGINTVYISNEHLTLAKV